jgi:hypothetical protein
VIAPSLSSAVVGQALRLPHLGSRLRNLTFDIRLPHRSLAAADEVGSSDLIFDLCSLRLAPCSLLLARAQWSVVSCLVVPLSHRISRTP